MVKPSEVDGAPLIWDMHGCPSRTSGNDLTYALERYRHAGFDAVTVNVADSYFTLEDALRTLASFRAQLAAHADRYLLARTPGDLSLARTSGRLAVSFDVEGVASIGDQLEVVDLYYDLGVRWMAFAYNVGNAAGAGCHDAIDSGLTAFGRRLVQRMEAAGIIKCCSHTGYRTAREVFEAGTKPSIFSHSNPRRLIDHERNVPDELLRACAATGGVVGINGVGLFLGTREPSATELFAHIDYVVQLIGPNHVGLGIDSVFVRPSGEETDFIDFSGRSSEDFWPAAKGYYPNAKILGPEILSELRALMVAAGYPPAAMAGILGGNFARVAAACWQT